MPSAPTNTFVSASTESSQPGVSWSLALALCAEGPREAAGRVDLDGVEVVEIGRGDTTAWRREGAALVLTLADRRASQAHARLRRDGEGWQLEDLGSKNGTRLNGEVIETAALEDGDVIECGATFLVARAVPAPLGTPDLRAPEGPHPMLRTLSASLQHDLELLARVARTPVPILLRGETGTGKEVVARAAYELSGRDGPFVAVNCAGLPPSLISSELFGVKRGAFSGAAQDREGLVRAAHGGTLFLDEIAELGPEPQAALLRVLQEHEVVPLGGTKTIKVDLRVIAATNQPLDQLVSSGKFRRDVLARLRGFELHLPPLRERREDLGHLVASLLDKIEPGRARTFHRTAARALMRHAWPLNVRELEQALGAATAVARSDEVTLEDLPVSLRGEPMVSRSPVGEPPTRERLAALIVEHAGNVSHVAGVLGTSRTQVRRLATRWGIDLEGARAKPP